MIDYRKQITERVRNLKAQYKNIYIFGAGAGCKLLLRYLYMGGVFNSEIFSGILVSGNVSAPSDVEGIIVKRIGETKIADDDVIIVTLLYDNAEVTEQLKVYRNVIPMRDIFPAGDIRDAEVRNYIEYFEQKVQPFKYIEIETINRCNGECAFCPVNRNEKQREYHKMSEELFNSIIEQLAEIDYKGCLALFSNNEPFLDERIIQFARHARERVPHAFIHIITNGKLVTLDKFKEIIPYLDNLLIDNYEPDKGKPENVLQIEREVAQQGISDKYSYFEIDKNAIRTSRGGNSPNSKISHTIDHICPLPYVQMVIRPDGKVSLCCNDALGENTLGDIREKPLMEIWSGDSYNKVRKAIKSGRHNLPTCRYCNYNDLRGLWEAQF